MLEFDILGLVDQAKKFIRREKGTLIGLFGLMVVVALLWKEVLGNFLSEEIGTFNAWLGFDAFYVLLGLAVIVWIGTRHISVPKNLFTIGIAPFEVVAIKDHPSGEDQYSIAQETVEDIYASLHHFREKMGFTDYIKFIRLPDRVDANFENAQHWTQRLKLGLLIWGNVRLDGDKMMLEPHFNFSHEPANIFYGHFKEKLNELHHFGIDFNDDNDESAQLMHYIIFIAMLFAGISESAAKRHERAAHIFAKLIAEISKESHKKSQTLTDILVASEFFQARNLHKWGNELLTGDNHDGALRKWDEASRVLLERAKKMEKLFAEQKDKKEKSTDLAIAESSLLYGVYLLSKEGKIKEAQQKLKQAHDYFGDDDEYLLTLAKVYQKMDPQKANEIFAEVIASTADEKIITEAEERLGEFYLDQKKWNEATELFGRKFKDSEKRPYEPDLFDDRGRRELASAYFKQHRWLSAQREILQAHIDSLRNKMGNKVSI